MLNFFFHYIKSIHLRLFLFKELDRVKNNGIIIPTDLRKRVWRNPSESEVWVNLLSSINVQEDILLIDIGANDGSWFNQFLNQFPNTNVHAFEPTSKCFEMLNNRFSERDNVFIYNYGISSSSKEVGMEIANDNRLSSLEKYSEFALNDRKGMQTSEESVTLKKLDDFDFDLETRKVCLKVDVQGHEIEVFRGARNILKNVDIVICELSFATEFINIEPSFSYISKVCYENGLFPIVFQHYGMNSSMHSYERDVIFVKEKDVNNIFNKI